MLDSIITNLKDNNISNKTKKKIENEEFLCFNWLSIIYFNLNQLEKSEYFHNIIFNNEVSIINNRNITKIKKNKLNDTTFYDELNENEFITIEEITKLLKNKINYKQKEPKKITKNNKFNLKTIKIGDVKCFVKSSKFINNYYTNLTSLKSKLILKSHLSSNRNFKIQDAMSTNNIPANTPRINNHYNQKLSFKISEIAAQIKKLKEKVELYTATSKGKSPISFNY
jgi:hypothetical protein